MDPQWGKIFIKGLCVHKENNCKSKEEQHGK